MAGPAIAEAYVMRKLHKEKLRMMEEEADAKESGYEAKQPSGCFLLMFKKIHPSRTITKQIGAMEEQGFDIYSKR